MHDPSLPWELRETYQGREMLIGRYATREQAEAERDFRMGLRLYLAIGLGVLTIRRAGIE